MPELCQAVEAMGWMCVDASRLLSN